MARFPIGGFFFFKKEKTVTRMSSNVTNEIFIFITCSCKINYIEDTVIHCTPVQYECPLYGYKYSHFYTTKQREIKNHVQHSPGFETNGRVFKFINSIKMDYL